MSLVAAPRANNLSQLNTVTEIKYSKRNSTARDHSMIAARSETPVHAPALSSGTVQDGLLDNPTAATADHEVVDFPTLRVQSPARPNLIAPSGAPHGASAPPCYALPISVCRLPVLVRPLGSAHAHNGVSSATMYVEMPDRSLESDPPDGVTADLDLNCIKLIPESWWASPNVVGLPRTHDG
jgi:hypothetical protein